MKKSKTLQKYLVLLFSTFAFMSSSGDLHSQSVADENIRKDFSAYLEALTSNEFEKSTEYLYPEFFEIFPKDLMIQAMDQAFNNPEVEMEIFDPKIVEVKSVAELDSFYFAPLKYSNSMRMKYNDLIVGTDEEKQLTIDILMGSLNSAFGSDNVTYNTQTESFTIYSEKDVVARSNNGVSDWKFLVLEEAQMPILKRLIPEEIIEGIK